MRSSTTTRVPSGFTLAELLVVIGIIVLSLSIVLPSVHTAFSAGAETQAIATMSAAMGAARGYAIEHQVFAVLHHQRDYLDQRFYAGVFRLGPTDDGPRLLPVEGYPLWQMPRNIGFGQVTAEYIHVGGQIDTYNKDKLETNNQLLNFTTFNVVFAPNGSLAEDVDGHAPRFWTGDDPLSPFYHDPDEEEQEVWGWYRDKVPIDIHEDGIRIMTVFDYERLKVVPDRAAELNENGRFLAINPYTGQLIPSE